MTRNKWRMPEDTVWSRFKSWAVWTWYRPGFQFVSAIMVVQFIIMSAVMSMEYFTRTGDHHGAYFEMLIWPCSMFLVSWMMGLGIAISYRLWFVALIQFAFPFLFPFVFHFIVHELCGAKTWDERRWNRNERERLAEPPIRSKEDFEGKDRTKDFGTVEKE